MQSSKDLNTLFAALREAKILVGPREVLRIHEILSRAENLDTNGLRSILVAVLVKSREEKHRFDELFRSFVHADADKLIPVDQPAPGDRKAPNPESPKFSPPATKRSYRRTGVFIAGTLLASLGGVFVATRYLSSGETLEFVDAGPAATSAASASSAPIAEILDASVDEHAPTPEQLYPDAEDWREDFDDSADAAVSIVVTEPEVQTDKRTFSAYVPRIDIQQQSFFTSSTGAIAGLGVLAIALGLIVSRWGLRHKLLPARAPAPTHGGPRELALSSPVTRDLELLDMQSEDALVWGVGRFITEEYTTNLDVEKSVLATVAAAGRPELRFERRGRHRQVCVWIDESATDPAIERLGREVALALSRVGLEVDVARFWAVPDKLVRHDGTIVSAAAIEEELAFSIVAILTDGHALTTRHAGADRSLGISRLMRMFARLPRLAFVDFGEGPSRASRVARAYGITAVRPDEAAAFLALGRKPEVRDMPARKLTGDVTAWAAACALGMRPIDEETAYDVRRVLGLSASPWSWAVVRRSGRQTGDWVEWPLEKRAELLDWLRRAEHGAETERVAPNSLLGKTIAYWKERLDAEANARTKTDVEVPWIGTPAERTLRIDRALLDLWDQPEEAATILYSFVGTDAEKLVQEKLGDFAALEAEGTRGVIVLPWRFAELSESSRIMFERLGFGAIATVRQDKLHGDLVERRGRLWMGLGFACGLGAGAMIAAVNSWRTAAFPCVIENVAGSSGWCEQIENWKGNGSRLIAGGLRGFAVQKEASRTDLPTLRFERQQVSCEGMNPQGWFAQRCGSQVPPEKTEVQGVFRRKLFVLQGSPLDQRVRSFGKTLLDRGAADVVLIRAVAPGTGELNDWLPILNLDHDKLVIVQMEDEVLARGSTASDRSTVVVLQFETYSAKLPKRSRMWTLPEKLRRVDWTNNSEALAFDTADHAVVVDEIGNVRQRKLPGFVSPELVPILIATLPQNNVNHWSWVSASADMRFIVHGYLDGTYWLNYNDGGDRGRRLSIPGGGLTRPVVWNSQNTRFAGITTIGSVVGWNATETTPYEFPAEKEFVPNAVAWAINGDELLVGTPEGVTMLSRQADPTSFPLTKQPISDIVGPVASKYLLISAKAGVVVVAGSNQVQQGPRRLEQIREIRAVTGAISPDGNNIVTVQEGGKVRIATIDNDILIDEFACDSTIAPAWSRDGKRLLVACGKTVYDRPVFSAMFAIRNLEGVCASREKLEKTFGLQSAEAALLHSHCDPSADY